MPPPTGILARIPLHSLRVLPKDRTPGIVEPGFPIEVEVNSFSCNAAEK
jgi:hypothetical protein